MSPEPGQRCADCGSPLDQGQRYCLACGARIGPRSPQLQDLIVRAREASAGPPAAETPPVPVTQAPARRRLTLPVVPIPSPGICALAVLTFLGFGVILGSAARSSVQDALAASTRTHEKLLVASAPAAAKPSHSSEAPASSEQAPSSEPESTPEAPARTTSSTPSTKASTTGAESESESPGTGESSEKKSTAGNPLTKLPPFKHVFVVMLSGQPYSAVFGPASQAPYLSKTLEQQGELLPHYDAVAHEELANGVALISGQGPTVETAANCPNYTEISPTGTGELEQVLGSGCVYPQSAKTLPGQLNAKKLTWRAYVQGMDETGSAGGCAHPVLGQADPTSGASPGTGTYSTFRNPFMYFHSIISSAACASDDVGFDHLSQDLTSESKTPNLSYIIPDRCHDGNPTPCAPGAPAGLAASETFLRDTVKEITASKAYKENGLLVITVDEAPSSGEFADSSSCCGQPRFPNVPSTTPRPKGGGEVGALLLSPYVKGATSNAEPYNHFSLLRTIEDIFGLSHLGYAAISQVKSLEPALFVEKG